MKTLIVSAVVTLVCLPQLVHAQAPNDAEKPRSHGRNMRSSPPMDRRERNGKPAKPAGSCRTVYLGFSTGIDNPAGLIGLDIDGPVSKHISLNGGIGKGTWGFKVYGGMRYYFGSCYKGFALGAGAAYSMGQNMTANMETIYATTETVTFKQDPQVNAFGAAYYFWKLGRRNNRMFAAAGYAARIGDFSYTQTSGNPISSTSASVMRLIAPGGPMIGIGFLFALH